MLLDVRQAQARACSHQIGHSPRPAVRLGRVVGEHPGSELGLRQLLQGAAHTHQVMSRRLSLGRHERSGSMTDREDCNGRHGWYSGTARSRQAALGASSECMVVSAAVSRPSASGLSDVARSSQAASRFGAR